MKLCAYPRSSFSGCLNATFPTAWPFSTWLVDSYSCAP